MGLCGASKTMRRREPYRFASICNPFRDRPYVARRGGLFPRRPTRRGKKKILFFLPLRLFLCALRDFVVQLSWAAGVASFEYRQYKHIHKRANDHSPLASPAQRLRKKLAASVCRWNDITQTKFQFSSGKLQDIGPRSSFPGLKSSVFGPRPSVFRPQSSVFGSRSSAAGPRSYSCRKA